MIVLKLKLATMLKTFYEPIVIIITQRFYRRLITNLKVIANFSDVSNLMEDDVVSGATDIDEK